MVEELGTGDIIMQDKDGAPDLGFLARVLEVEIEDSGGNRRRLKYYVADSDAISLMYSALSAIISGTIIGVSYNLLYSPIRFQEPGVDAQVEAKAKIRIFSADYKGERVTFYIPSPSPSIFLSTTGDGANVVDPSNVDVLAFVALFDAGGSVYIDKHGTHGDGFSDGIRVTHKSKRG